MTAQPAGGNQELAAARRSGRWLLVWAFVFSAFVNLLMLTGPLYMLQVYDRVLTSRSVETLVALTVLVAVLFLLMGVLDYARGRLMARVAARVQTALDARVFQATLRRSVQPQDRDAVAAAWENLDAVRRFIASPVLLAVFDMPWVPVFVLAIFLFHPMLGWLAVGGAVVIVALALANQMTTRARVQEAKTAALRSARFSETARSGGEIVLSQGLRETMSERHGQLRIAALAQSLRASDLSAGFTAATKAFRMFLQSAMLGAGAYLVIRGPLSPGAMIAASVLLGRGLAPIEQAMGGWPVLQRGRAGWKGLAGFLDETPPAPRRTRLPVPVPRLSVRDLCVVAPGGTGVVIENLTFQLNPGQAMGVIGASGAGKSTLARALVGYWPITAGEARLGGAALEQYDPDTLGRHIGYLPQSVTLFPGTVAENIARMAHDPQSDGVMRAARRANAHDMILSLPDGYDTYLEGDLNQLSGGQRQRVALARAFFGEPELLVLDEPDSMLDADGSEALSTAVRDFKSTGRSILIMTHRPAAISECDTLMVIDKGRMVALGPRETLLAKRVRGVDSVPGRAVS